MTSTLRKTSSITIIIPTLNEADNIGPLAENLKECGAEKLIVDGGSQDATVAMAKAHGFTVIHSSIGRARQLNNGARLAKGKILLFLHADTRLPVGFSEFVEQVMADHSYAAGAFRLAICNGTPAMRFIAWCANLRSRYRQLPYGDQAIFVRKATFNDLGMFPEIPIMEDYLFIKKAQQAGKICLLPQYAITSARRWEKLGVLRTTVINQLVIIGFHLGISARHLVLLYRR